MPVVQVVVAFVPLLLLAVRPVVAILFAFAQLLQLVSSVAVLAPVFLLLVP